LSHEQAKEEEKGKKKKLFLSDSNALAGVGRVFREEKCSKLLLGSKRSSRLSSWNDPAWNALWLWSPSKDPKRLSSHLISSRRFCSFATDLIVVLG
jgi:hypothetical protein